MKYLTGVHALNLNCSLLTCGDWHQSALAWKNLTIRDTEDSVFGDYGIEYNKSIPEHAEKYAVANHIRALLDLLETGNFTEPQGMRKDFICNETYTSEVFAQVKKLRSSPHWEKIDRFMGKEYYSDWLDFKEKERIA